MKKETLIQKFKDNQGWLHSKDFGYQTNIYDLLTELIENGQVKKVKKGLFVYLNTNRYDEEEHISKYYPTAVLCLFSAWNYHGLSTTIPYQHHLAIPHKANLSKLDYPPVKFYYWSEHQYQLGVIQENNRNVYDIEKSVCDAVKFRNKIGDEIMFEVIKNYMDSKNRNIEKLMTYAGQMRVEKIMSPMLKPLI